MNTKQVPRNLTRRIEGSLPALVTVALMLLALAVLVIGTAPRYTSASSHREAPLISGDPEADNTDLYAFRSPDLTNTVTIIANYVPLEEPNGGPNFGRFGDNVLYEIKIDNTGNGEADVVYQFRFHSTLTVPGTWLYNYGPIALTTTAGLPSKYVNLNYHQYYTVTRIKNGQSQVLGQNLETPPVNVGPRSTPNYDALANAAIYNLSNNGGKVFAGQRDDPFFVDLGSIFDLAGLRPFNSLHLIPLSNTTAIDGVRGYNTHSIAIQVPIGDLTNGSNPNIGVWATASRQAVRILRYDGSVANDGRWVQVSRLGEPLINEVVIPLAEKDYWNATYPSGDKYFAHYYTNPSLTAYENLLYPALDNANESGRADLVAILLTGVPNVNYTGNTKADLLRLNTAIPPSATEDRLAALNGDFAGFPNGRRLRDDIVDIELRATAEGYGDVLSNALGLPNRTPNNLIGDGVDQNDLPFTASFPYMARPWQGYESYMHTFAVGLERRRDLSDK